MRARSPLLTPVLASKAATRGKFSIHLDYAEIPFTNHSILLNIICRGLLHVLSADQMPSRLGQFFFFMKDLNSSVEISLASLDMFYREDSNAQS